MFPILHHNTKDTPSFVRISRHSCSPFCITTQKTHRRLFAYRVIHVSHSASQHKRHTVVCSHIASLMFPILHITIRKTHRSLFAYRVIHVSHSASQHKRHTVVCCILRHYCSPFCISQYERHTVVCSHIASFMSAILHHCNDSYRNKIPNLTSQVCLLQRVATLVSNVIIVPHSAYHNTKDTVVH